MLIIFVLLVKPGKVSNAGTVGRLWRHENVDNFGIVGKAGKVSKVCAIGRLWPKLVELVMLVL